MNNDETRISKLRDYLFEVIDTLTTDNKYQINADMLDTNPNNYSLNKIPTQSDVEKWVTGGRLCKDVYSFRSRKAYSQDAINNLNNIGFFEKFQKLIDENNKKGIWPQIQNVESIECLNQGTLVSNETNTAEFQIQIQVTYREE